MEILTLDYEQVRGQSSELYNKVRQNFTKKHLKYFREIIEKTDNYSQCPTDYLSQPDLKGLTQ